MKAVYFFIVVLLGCAILAVVGYGIANSSGGPTPASSVKWMGHFGYSRAFPGASLCLMARGYFQAAISPEMPELITAWLRAHPKAIVTPVAHFTPKTDKDPGSKLTFVWVVDGESNLNLELVRQGFFAPKTQTIGEHQKLEVPHADYDAFIKQALDIGEKAKEKKLGVWQAAAPID